MPTLLSSVASRSEETVDATLLSYVRAVDSVDPADAQNPDVWTLSGPGSPRIVRVDALRDGGRPDRVKAVRAYVDGALAPGGAYAFGPKAALKLSTGAAAPAETLPFVGPSRASPAAPASGADLARRVRAAPDGGLALLGRVDALKARLELVATAALGAFGHLPGFGSPAQPKRTLSQADLANVARALGAQVAADPDVRRSAVSVGRDPTTPGVVVVEFAVEPRFDARPFSVRVPVVAYAAP